jgi:pimeloyl-ACP methyl ester carboxylesterase
MIHFTEHYITRPDNIRIYYRRYNTGKTHKPAMLCLPALTRNAKSFDSYARYMAEKYDISVICPDMRGRGQSDYDAVFMNYNLWTEVNDILDIISHENCHELIITGTSRGGMQSGVLASIIPEKIKGVILNDIGATIPMVALERLKKLFSINDTLIGDYNTALRVFYIGDNNMTKGLTPNQESDIIHSLFKHDNGLYYRDYDYQGMGQAYLASFQGTEGLVYCDLKAIFANLSAIPTLLLHGENSDILTDKCVMDTKSVIPSIEYHKFSNRGHVLFFNEPEAIDICCNFVNKII